MLQLSWLGCVDISNSGDASASKDSCGHKKQEKKIMLQEVVL